VGHDITERKRVEAALRESEARYRRQALYLQLAADVAGVATSSLDLEQVLLRVTTLLCERFGYYYVAIFLLDESGAWAVLQASSGGARARPVEAGQRLERGGPTFVGYVTQTGQPRVSQSVGADAAFLFDTLMPGTQAEAVIPLLVGGMVIGALDVHSATPHVFEPEVVSILTTLAGQIAIAVQNARLHAAQKARALELEQAYHALQENQARLLLSEKLASLGRLTAGIAHEMNSPLAAVRATLAQLSALVTEYQASLDDAHVTVDDHREIGREMREALRLAQQGAERAAAFVRSIKVQTRETGPLQPERFNAVDLVNETLLLLHHPLRQGGCAVTFEPGSDYVALHGSPGRLALAVTNLVTNAIEASATKGGGLIQLVLAAQAEGVSLRVSDQGSGIPADVQPRIFDPMFSTKPFGQSTGMGLTVVHNIIVGEFGGTIEVESLPGQGATFTLHFPHPPSPRADPAVPETRPESGDDERPT
jgi:signal transduction histidine kinase